MKAIDTSRKEDMKRVFKTLEANTKARIQEKLKQFEVVRVIPTISGLAQEVVHTTENEEEAGRYVRLLKCFPPSNADYYYKPWGTPFKGGSK